MRFPYSSAIVLSTLVTACLLGGCTNQDASDEIPRFYGSPPISGGTLAVTSDGRTAIAADPDRDVVFIVDLEQKRLAATVNLSAGDEPGRVALDGAGRAHVALRSGGAFVTIDIAAGKILERRAVCAQPRGIVYDAAIDGVHVACATGELATFPAKGGPATRVLALDRDLRDVVVQDDKLLVSLFRSAEVLVVSSTGSVIHRAVPPSKELGADAKGRPHTAEPSVAYRMIPRPGGGAVMLHQRADSGPIVIKEPGDSGSSGGYASGGSSCPGAVVQTTVTEIEPGNAEIPIVIPPIASNSFHAAPVPVDIAVSNSGGEIAYVIVAAGTNSVFRVPRTKLTEPIPIGCDDAKPQAVPAGQPIAAALYGDGMLAVQVREPATLVVLKESELFFYATRIPLSDDHRWDLGHAYFHGSAAIRGSIACASCHPEGNDDHRTWNFDPIGPRRTQSIRGGILETAPLHWDGDIENIDHLMQEVFERRMGGSHSDADRVSELGRFLDLLKPLPLPAPTNPEAAARGKALFFDETVGCASCHSGEKGTNNQLADVGTGKAFQVAPLMGLVDRAPYMHDGCAKTLRDRFDGSCGGGDAHGVTSHLTPQQLDDLVAYLETR